MLKNTFQKNERLVSRKHIADLFEHGYAVYAYPIKAFYQWVESSGAFPAQAAFSVAKKRFPKATDRNRLKRQMREAYRLAKPDFYQRLVTNKQCCRIIYIYVGNKMEPYDVIDSGIRTILAKITTSDGSK